MHDSLVPTRPGNEARVRDCLYSLEVVDCQPTTVGINCVSSLAEVGEGRPPINVKFEIPYFTTSGIQVSLYVHEVSSVDW